MSPNIIGKVLQEQFRVEEFIASGGMGAVYRVWDLKRNVLLAMKVLHSDLADDPVVFKRFQREANALKKLAHPNIVPFYGLYQTLDLAFLLERFVDGPSLSEILRQRQSRPLPVGDALVYLKALCAALGYAHANGVVHCDVKPGNVMVDRGGVYLTDFGIARHAESTTTTMGVAGTPAYMAPEQIRGEAVSPATDVYALGVMLFEMLTGQRPFRGNETGTEKGGATTNERIRYGHLNLAPPDPRSLNPNLPVGLSNAILQSLSKRAEARFTSTQALLTAVCAAAGISPASVSDRVTVQDLPAQDGILKGQPELPDRNSPAAEEVLPAGKKLVTRTAWVVVIICVVLAVLGSGIYALTRAKPVATPRVVPGRTGADTVFPTPTVEQPVVLPVITDTPIPSPTATLSPTATNPPVSTPGIGTTQTSHIDNMKMVFVPAGQFTMGTNSSQRPDDEKPEHIVSLDAYWIDQTEVTNSMFSRFVNDTQFVTDLEKAGVAYTFDGAGWPSVSGGSWQHPFGPSTSLDGRENYPVIQVSWYDAAAYCKWALRRLPTEAEWEKAARGPDGNTYPWGNGSPSGQLANYDNLVGDLSPVESFPAGASYYGVLDITGNVYEWVADWYGAAYYSSSSAKDNPKGPSTGTHKVMRGGSWQLYASTLPGYQREVSQPEFGNSNLGFRCAQDAR